MNLRLQTFLIVTTTLLCATTASQGAVPNELFYAPADPVPAPTDWKSSNYDVIRPDALGRSVLSIVGNGESSQWLSAPIRLESRKAYCLRFKASCAREGAGDYLCVGTPFANDDNNGVATGDAPQEERSFVFFTPDGKDGRYSSPVRFAQWQTRREYLVAEPQLNAVSPMYRRISKVDDERDSNVTEFLTLGEGESIDESGVYRFESFKSRERSNFDRPLYSITANYNTNRWILTDGANVVYRFALVPIQMVGETASGALCKSAKPITFSSGVLHVNIGYHTAGKTVVEASCDNESWVKLGEINGLGAPQFDLQPLLGTGARSELLVRLTGDQVNDAGGCNMQAYGLSVELQTNQDPTRRFIGRGETLYANLSNERDASQDFDHVLTPRFFDDFNVYVTRSDSDRIYSEPWTALQTDVKGLNLLSQPGRHSAVQYELFSDRPANILRTIFPFNIQNFTNGIKGMTLTGDDAVNLETSWCDADYHVSRDPKITKILPERDVELFAAQNDYESFQIVFRSREKPIEDIQATLCKSLTSENGDAINDENVNLRYAYFHYVDDPTDTTCAHGFYPDALIPFDAGADGKGAKISAEANRNFLVWVTVKTPKNTKPGKYEGKVKITANGGAIDMIVPFRVNVWDVALPEKNTLETAYGCSAHNIWRYHNCKTEQDKRAIFEKYLQIYGEYRMSIYSPAPLDPIRVEIVNDEKAPEVKLDFEDFDREMKRVFEKYNFTNFRLDFRGLGGGTFAERYEGKLGDYEAGTPLYDAVMTQYGKKLQEHLREIGLLDAAYVYCFDEPEEKDYEFVAGEFAKLKKYAPEITRMLTEEPTPKFEDVLAQKDAKVDVWCPISNCYSDELSRNQRANGSRFWWYVCTGPKAPYCTEFLDHPAQELRIWHWQAFERDIVGSLIWETTYWNSPTLFGDGAQNPYLDPMCYMTGYGLPAGTKRPWGNGDGRFVYPPLTAAVPGMNDGRPVMDAPNASIRLEMIRAGVQDYELMLLFKAALLEKQELLEASERANYEALLDFDEITTDMTHFTADPQVLLQRRREIGEAIQTLKAK